MVSIDDYDYPLPDELIARHPTVRRDQSRLMVLPQAGPRRELRFAQITEVLRPDDLLVLNDSRVLPARLEASKPTGGRVELLCVERGEDGAWSAMAKGARGLRAGMPLQVEGASAPVEVEASLEGGFVKIRLPDEDFLRRFGALPLPPYMRREAEPEDADRYQTVYAQEEGSVAAPTAGLHFTEALLDEVASMGVHIARLTLHVGPGTFLPVKADDPADHQMHAERFVVPGPTAAAVARAHAEGRRVVAVGTTTTRVLESFRGDVEPGPGSTALFIKPGHEWRHVDALITNFHLPRSTLLMLVCAFAGRAPVLAAYEQAVQDNWRFYSYGDAMFLERPV